MEVYIIIIITLFVIIFVCVVYFTRIGQLLQVLREYKKKREKDDHIKEKQVNGEHLNIQEEKEMNGHPEGGFKDGEGEGEIVSSGLPSEANSSIRKRCVDMTCSWTINVDSDKIVDIYGV